MKKVGWYAASAALILIIGGGLILLAANLYVQSSGVQQRIRQALVSTLHMPAELTKTTITPWEGLRIDGITIRPEADAGAPVDVIKADSFRVRFALGPLLARHFVVNEVLLDRPQLAWAQDAQGRWRFPPEKIEAAETPAPPEPSPANTRAPENAPPAVAAATAPPAPRVTQSRVPVAKPTRFSVDVDRYRLRHGSLAFLSASSAPIGQFEEVNVDGRMHGPRSSSGTLWFDKATLPKAGLALTSFQSRFSFDEHAGFSLDDGKAGIGGGQVYVNASVHPDDPGTPFTAQCHFENVALEHLAPSLGDAVQGRLQGVLKVSGLAGDPSSRQGTGQFSLIDGKLKDFAMLKAIGESMRIEDLSRLELKKAQLDCHLEGQKLVVDSLNLVSNDLRLTATGQYDGEGDQLALQARLIIDQAVGRQLPQFIETNFTRCGDEAPGCRYVDFVIGGSISKPSTNFLERVLSGPMGSLFQNILAPKQKGPKKPKKDRSIVTPTPEPAASPTA